MSNATLVRSLAQHSEELSRDLDAFSDRAFELVRLAKELQERSGRQVSEKATQVETTAVGAPAFHLDRAKRIAPFAFQPLDRKLNWRKLRALNLDRVVKESDTRSVLDLYGEVAYADLERESVYDLSEANLLKLVRVMQLLLQCQQYQLDQGRDVQALLREDQAATVALLGMVSHLDMGGVEAGLANLQDDFYRVADADMDAMFAQVRTEERTGARDTVGSNVDQAKSVLDLRVFGGNAQQQQQQQAGQQQQADVPGRGSVALGPAGGRPAGARLSAMQSAHTSFATQTAGSSSAGYTSTGTGGFNVGDGGRAAAPAGGYGGGGVARTGSGSYGVGGGGGAASVAAGGGGGVAGSVGATIGYNGQVGQSGFGYGGGTYRHGNGFGQAGSGWAGGAAGSNNPRNLSPTDLGG